MTKEEIINLANRCSRKIWEICMEEPGFSTNDCPEGANGLSDIVLNVIIKEFPATKECSSLPTNLDEATKEYAEPYHDKMAVVKAFKAGAEWKAEQGETFEGVIRDNGFIDFDEYGSSMMIPSNVSCFNNGDRVIIQIRKKY